jgi:hypothetical protein
MIWFNASSAMWWGGFAVGPRYLLPGLPFLALGLAFALRAWKSSRFFLAIALAAGLWSWLATWGLTLAGQAFPSDALHNPLLEYAWPNWVAGNVARNLGTLIGIPGPSSLLPLAGTVGVLLLAGWRRPADGIHTVTRDSASGASAPSQMAPFEDRSAGLRRERNR